MHIKIDIFCTVMNIHVETSVNWYLAEHVRKQCAEGHVSDLCGVQKLDGLWGIRVF